MGPEGVVQLLLTLSLLRSNPYPDSCVNAVAVPIIMSYLRAVPFCTDHVALELCPEGVFAMSAMEDFATAEADTCAFACACNLRY